MNTFREPTVKDRRIERSALIRIKSHGSMGSAKKRGIRPFLTSHLYLPRLDGPRTAVRKIGIETSQLFVARPRIKETPRGIAARI